MKRDAQVYLRWAGQRGGERFETVGSGPWGVMVDGNVVLLDHVDDVELERDRSYLETRGVTDMVLQMCCPVDGRLETWQTVVNAKRGVETGLDIGDKTYPIETLKGPSYYKFRIVVPDDGVKSGQALSQQYGVFEAARGWSERIGFKVVDFRLPA